VQELAFTFADAIAYVQAAIDAGMDIDDFAGRLSFFFNAHNNLFEEIAKFRAARRLWAHIMRDRFHAQKDRSMMLRFHTQTGGSTLTAQQPDNNIVRVTLQALAAVLGGTQSLHTNSRDEALCLPTEESVQIALRTQQIIAHESNVADTIDPLAGSYYIEHLTNEIEKGAREYIERIDSMGGMLRAIETGYVQREIQESAYRQQIAFEREDAIVVGVNHFVDSEENTTCPIMTVDPHIGEQQVEHLEKLRQKRDTERVTALLSRLENMAHGNDNLMPIILECVEAYATLGEICDVLRSVFGEYVSSVTI